MEIRQALTRNKRRIGRVISAVSAYITKVSIIALGVFIGLTLWELL